MTTMEPPASLQAERIRFLDENGDMTVFVYNLPPNSTVQQVRELFAYHSLTPVVGVFVRSIDNNSKDDAPNSGTASNKRIRPSYAICVLGSPRLARRALNLR